MTTTLTHSDYAALLAACAYDPDEDTPRLALADWLEENDDPVRGEFIRVQVELARHIPAECPKCRKVAHRKSGDGTPICMERAGLIITSKDLLDKHEARWRRGPECERCGGNGWRRKSDTHRGRDCPACHGTGWERWWLAERRIVDHPDGPRSTTTWRHRVHFERGFIEQVDCNLADVFHDDGTPTEWAMAVVRSEPCGRRFGVVDRPAEQQPDAGAGMWYLPYDDLPPCLQKIIGPMPGFDSPAAANRALAESAWSIVERAVRAGVSGSNGGG